MSGLDAIVARLQNMHSFNIFEVQPDGQVKPWYEVTTTTLIPELIINEANLLEQVQTISARIAHWGRLSAQAKRVWQIEERNYRRWRDSFYLQAIQMARVKGEKKPSDKTIEAQYRTSPEYNLMYGNTERAEESYNATLAILDGWRMKKEALRIAAYRRNEDGASILSL